MCCFCQVIKCDEGSTVWKFRDFTHTIIFNKNSVKSTPLFCLTNFVIQFHEIFPSNCERIMIFSTLCKANIQRPTLKKAYTVTIISFSINGFSQKKEKTRISALMHKGHGGSQSPLYQGLIILLQKKCWTVHEFLQQIVAHFYPLPNLVDSVLPTIYLIIVSLGL